MVDIEGFRAGDEAAIRAVYRQYGKAVHTVARSVTRDPELVADIVQLTFTKAWRAANSFDQNRELGPWLYAIARRCAIDVVRKESRPTAGGHGPEVDQPVAPPSFQRTWEMHEVRRAIDSLPDIEAQVVRMAHLEGRTHSDIAQRLNIPPGTVKSRLNRAHRRLTAALGHLSDDDREPNPHPERKGG